MATPRSPEQQAMDIIRKAIQLNCLKVHPRTGLEPCSEVRCHIGPVNQKGEETIPHCYRGDVFTTSGRWKSLTDLFSADGQLKTALNIDDSDPTVQAFCALFDRLQNNSRCG